MLAHRRAAELLHTNGAEPERVAAHLVLVPASGDPFVVETLRVAADRAIVRGAPDAAVRYLRRALGMARQAAAHESRSKLQIPTSNLQRNSEFQYPI